MLGSQENILLADYNLVSGLMLRVARRRQAKGEWGTVEQPETLPPPGAQPGPYTNSTDLDPSNIWPASLNCKAQVVSSSGTDSCHGPNLLIWHLKLCCILDRIFPGIMNHGSIVS